MIVQNILQRKIRNDMAQEPGRYNSDELLKKKALKILRALNHPARRQILQLLDQYGKMSKSEICIKLHLEDFAASQHLAILQDSEFVIIEENSKFYRVNYNQVIEANQVNKQLRK
jgi:DNA-binding transcriptional ArsR family regulator